VLSVVTLAAACCGVVAGAAAPAGASPQAPVSAWGTEQQVPGLAALATGSVYGFTSGINSLSCGAAGNCAGGGVYEDSADDEEAFVVDETGGTWGTAQVVPGLAALSTGVEAGIIGIKSVINSLSCGAAGDCAAGGYYADSAGHQQAFVVDETAGIWGAAEEVPGLAALNAGGVASVNSVSCLSAGNCAAVGTYSGSSGQYQAFVVDETAGIWGTAEAVPGLAANPDVTASAVSCASAGNCAAGGSDGGQAFVVDETGGTWGTAQELSGLGVDAVSCPSPGNCTATGQVVTQYSAYNHGAVPQAFVVDEISGTWGTPKLLAGTLPPLPGGSYQTGSMFSSVSCPSAGNCVAVGDIYPNNAPVIMAEESGGSWGAARQLTGTSALSPPPLSVSCPSAGNCAVGGFSTSNFSAALVLDETDGSWGTPQDVPGSAFTDVWNVASMSCAAAGYCTAGGTYYSSSARTSYGFVIDEKPPTSTVAALSPAKVTYGKEQAERVSVTVSAPAGATPSGTVTVNAGTTVICSNVSLAAGQASCTVAATKLPAGTWHLTATYSGSTSLAPSTSTAQTLAIAKATSKITLSLSAAKVTYGHERSERLTVKVTSQYGGIPTGKVAVKSGKTTVCTITLGSGKGSCTLAAKKLPAGTRTLIAVYGGNGDFTAATSARKALKVVK